MAKLGDLVVNIGANTKQLNKDLGKVRREMKRFGSNFKSLGRDLSRSVTLPLLAIGAAAVKSASDLETLETSFISLTGGAEQARDMMKQLNDFTAQTPFQIDAVANSARQLIASGTKISEVNDQLQFLGDIAATSGSSINEIAAIFAKVNAKGKVELESLNQLAERGIPIFKALSDATGLPASKLGAGRVSVEQFNAVLKSFAQEGGFAAGAMERLSETASGKFSTAMDNLKLAGAELAESLMPAIKDTIDGITRLAQKFTKLDDSTKKFILTAGLVVAAVGPILVILPQLAAGLDLITGTFGKLALAFAATPFGMVTLALGGIAGAVMLFADNTNRAVEKNKEFIASLGELDKEAQRVAINTQIRLLKEEQTKLEIAQRAAERQLQAGGGGEVGVGAMSRRGGEFLKFGEDVQEARDRVAGLEQALLDLDSSATGTGASLTSAAGEAVDVFNPSVEESKGVVSEMTLKLNELAHMGTMAFETLSNGVQEFTVSSSEQLLAFLNDFEVVSEQIDQTANKTTEAFNGLGNALGNTFGDLITGAIDGKEALKQFASQVIAALVSTAIANAIASGSSASNPANQVSAGLTIPSFITSAMSVVAGAITQIPAFAEGGMVYGPGLAMVGDNKNAAVDPEVIAPLSKLKSIMGGNGTNVYGRISGDDIVISNDRATRDRNRFE